MNETAARRFDAIAANYAASEVHVSSPTLERLQELLQGEADLRVCDVACGAGPLGLALAARAREVVGVDPAPRMLEAFRAAASARGVAQRAVQAMAEALPLPDASFDLVATRLAAHHFEDVARAVREMARVTRPGGRVAVIDLVGFEDPTLDGLNHQLEVLHDPTHVRSYTLGRWCAFLETADLAVEHAEGGWSERPSGVALSRWCAIADSGPAAEAALTALLEGTPAATREALGVRHEGSEFRVPVRTCILVATKPLRP